MAWVAVALFSVSRWSRADERGMKAGLVVHDLLYKTPSMSLINLPHTLKSWNLSSMNLIVRPSSEVD